MNTEKLKLIFDGPAVDKGEIDVQDLAPALLALGELIETTNGAINGNRAKVSVCVRATAEGSFEVELALVQSLLEHGKHLLDLVTQHKDTISAAKDLSELLFGGTGLYALLKFLKGGKPDNIEEAVDSKVVVNIGTVNFITSRDTVKLAESVEVRNKQENHLPL
jgi:hypothetical protein